MKAALYLRVSTDKQELENQLEPLKKFAKGRGLKVVQVYRDMATGKNSNRPPVASKKRTDALKLLQEGMSYGKVARQLKIGKASAYRWYKGVPKTGAQNRVGASH